MRREWGAVMDMVITDQQRLVKTGGDEQRLLLETSRDYWRRVETSGEEQRLLLETSIETGSCTTAVMN